MYIILKQLVQARHYKDIKISNVLKHQRTFCGFETTKFNKRAFYGRRCTTISLLSDFPVVHEIIHV